MEKHAGTPTIIGLKGFIPQHGWNFSRGSFTVIREWDNGNIEIEHEHKSSSGAYDRNFILQRLEA